MTVPAKQTVGNYLNMPNTKKFLEDNLNEKKSEFVSNLLALVDGDNKLAECDPKKLVMCAMNATALNLPLNKNLGYAYVIPYKGIPSFQIGYKGLIQLAIRSGQYKYLNACEIKEGEIERNKITGVIKFIGENETGKTIGYLAYLELNTGFTASAYMTLAQIEAHAVRFSKMYANDLRYKSAKSKWSDPLARPKMALKTVLKSLLGTWGIMSTEMQKAFENDTEHEGDSGNFRDITPLQEEDPKPQTDGKKKVNLKDLDKNK
jgi:recombination protein RecT